MLITVTPSKEAGGAGGGCRGARRRPGGRPGADRLARTLSPRSLERRDVQLRILALADRDEAGIANLEGQRLSLELVRERRLAGRARQRSGEALARSAHPEIGIRGVITDTDEVTIPVRVHAIGRCGLSHTL